MGGRADDINDSVNVADQPVEDAHNRVPAKGLPLPECAGEVRSQLLFSFRPQGFVKTGNLPPFAAGHVRDVVRLAYYAVVVWNDCDTPKLCDDGSKAAFHLLVFKSGRSDQRLNPHDELVFVRDVQPMEKEKFTVPVRIGFGLAYCFDDLFSGEMYFSHSDHRFKTLRFLTKRELDVIGRPWVEWRDYLPDELVEGGTEIVNGVPDDKCEFWRNGFMLMHLEPAFSYFWISDEGETARTGLKKPGFFRMIISDVLARPSDF